MQPLDDIFSLAARVCLHQEGRKSKGSSVIASTKVAPRRMVKGSGEAFVCNGDLVKGSGEAFVCNGDPVEGLGEAFVCNGELVEGSGETFVCNGDLVKGSGEAFVGNSGLSQQKYGRGLMESAKNH